jgi:heme-degrading monooxygenase HmoA
MFAVIFIVEPKPEHRDAYLDVAMQLKPILESVDGFIAVERFASERREARLLSLSTWHDEKAVVRWRTVAEHHAAQEAGRFALFADYHLRVGEVTADTDPPAGSSIVQQRFDETVAGRTKALTITELEPGDGLSVAPDRDLDGLVERERFASIYRPGKALLLAGWRDAASAERFRPPAMPDVTMRHRSVRVIRDYGMRDRREAPQYYAEVPSPIPAPR